MYGSNYKRVYRNAMEFFKNIERHTKRKPYVRSAYFNKQKIFFTYFWTHLSQKPRGERLRRLWYFPAGIELLQHSHNHPSIIKNPNKENETLYRFLGETKEGNLFLVQIKEHKKTRTKNLMSIFPREK